MSKYWLIQMLKIMITSLKEPDEDYRGELVSWMRRIIEKIETEGIIEP